MFKRSSFLHTIIITNLSSSVCSIQCSLGRTFQLEDLSFGLSPEGGIVRGQSRFEDDRCTGGKAWCLQEGED